MMGAGVGECAADSSSTPIVAEIWGLQGSPVEHSVAPDVWRDLWIGVEAPHNITIS